VPASHDDDSKSGSSPDEPTLIGDSGDTVGFLDAPGLGPERLSAAIAAAVENLEVESVLTVYNDHPSGRSAVEKLCRHEGLALVATIGHPRGGTTFTLRKQR
jgi:hypothetical protein